jgi:hypothetical protein
MTGTPVPISGLPAGTTPLTGTEEIPAVQGGVTVKTTAQDIANLGGGGGSTISLTADTDLAAGTGVSINSSGNAVQGFMASPVLSSLTTVFQGDGNPWALLKLDTDNWLAALGDFSRVGGIAGAVPISFSGNVPTLGTFLQDDQFENIGFGTASATPPTYPSPWDSTGLFVQGFAALSSSSFIMVYPDQANSNITTIRVGTISGGVITMGTKAAVDATATEQASIAVLSATKVAITYNGGPTGIWLTICTISGTTVTVGTPVAIEVTSFWSYVSTIDATHVLAVYADHANSNQLTAQVYSISGTTPSPVGSASVLSGAVPNGTWPQPAEFDSTHFVVGWAESTVGGAELGNSNSTRMAAIFVDGGFNVTWGTPVTLFTIPQNKYPTNQFFYGHGSTDTVMAPPFIAILDATHAAVAPNNGFAHTEVYTLSSDTTLTGGGLQPTEPSRAYFNAFVAQTTANVILGLPPTPGMSNIAGLSASAYMVVDNLSTVYEGDTSQISTGLQHFGLGNYQVAKRSSTQVLAIFDDLATGETQVRLVNWNDIASPPIGCTASAVTSGDTATVVPVGSCGGFSGLAAGASYYFNGDGTVVTANTGHPAGVATDATHLILKMAD